MAESYSIKERTGLGSVLVANVSAAEVIQKVLSLREAGRMPLVYSNRDGARIYL